MTQRAGSHTSTGRQPIRHSRMRALSLSVSAPETTETSRTEQNCTSAGEELSSTRDPVTRDMRMRTLRKARRRAAVTTLSLSSIGRATPPGRRSESFERSWSR